MVLERDLSVRKLENLMKHKNHAQLVADKRFQREKLLVEKAIADVLLQKTSVNINDSGKTNVTIEFDGYRAAEAFFKNKVLW